ncbi:ABC transporter permease [Alkalicoccobacillus plakortidis]|uniref:ABC transporter permease n=1 Tax=Alkalicoccobacillus plakortidis TaxID=444060 RepID=A0ABT0XKF9_9BACI|nr:ABC transporter permease [Alkalicoccobacillus plakortidis]MCM2676386.1 ABC transporter permease [Alkalicoccobacillus plakortidis]
MRWRYLFRFYFRQVMKSKLYIIASLMAIILIISRIYLYLNTWFDQEDYGQLPADIVVVVQAVSILYILFFYRLFSNEILYGIQNIFVDGYKIMLEKMSALLLVHVVLQLGITFLVFMMYSGVYALIGIEFSVFYLSLLRFLIVYMLGPIILLFFYGILVAIIFEKRKIAIIAILMIWLFTGVINQEIFRDFFTQVSANDLFPLLSIGPESMHLIYLSYIGFNLDVGNELTLLTWFLLLTIIILLLAVKWTSVNREKRATWISALILFVLAIGSGYGVLHFSKNSFNFAATEETSYYQSLREAPTDLDYEIKSYQINMNQNKVDASITFNKTHTNTPTFQLYHAYPVVSVSIDNREVLFEREGDIIKVYSETKEFESLSISYQLVDTSYIPYSANKTTLLANYAWYPKRSHEHMYIDKANPYMPNSYPKLSDSLFTPEVYEFKVKTDRILFTNLELKGDHYEGEAQAVTLLRGQGQATHL